MDGVNETGLLISPLLSIETTKRNGMRSLRAQRFKMGSEIGSQLADLRSVFFLLDTHTRRAVALWQPTKLGALLMIDDDLIALLLAERKRYLRVIRFAFISGARQQLFQSGPWNK